MGQVSVSVEASVLALQYQRMQRQLEKERALRKNNEDEISALKQLLKDGSHQSKQNKKSAIQRREAREAYQKRQLTGLKSNGVPIATSGEGVKSFEEFKKMSDYLFEIKQYKLWLLWCLGTSTGLRISDLIQLKWGYVFLNGEFRERFPKVEQKTGKLNNILITEAMRIFVVKYLSVVKITPNPDDLIFPSREKFKCNPLLSEEENEILKRKKEKGYASGLSQRLKKYGQEIGLQHKTSHSMRHTFASIVFSLYDGGKNMGNLEVVSGLLNHYDKRTTARYCDRLQNEYDNARIIVSDFLLGKTKIKDLK